MYGYARIKNYIRWHPGGALPPHLLDEYDRLEAIEHRNDARASQAEDWQFWGSAEGTLPADDVVAELSPELAARAQRREAEHALADYLESKVLPVEPSMARVINKARMCRTSGYCGWLDGQATIAWDSKCGDVHLCPDESREETARLIRRYVEHMAGWIGASPLHRGFYAVLTWPNAPRGDLKVAKAAAFAHFARWLKKFPNCKGALVCQEDPLSAAHDWNVHLNVILLWSGRCNWEELREEWNHWAHIQLLDKDGLTGTMRELVKYSAKLVRQERDKRAPGDDDESAPPMVEWPPHVFLEWYAAQSCTRRVRSYGVLYAIERRRWTDASPARRKEWIVAANTHGVSLGLLDTPQAEWSEFSDAERTALRKAISEGAQRDLAACQWVGKLEFRDGAYAAVSSIRGTSTKDDNSHQPGVAFAGRDGWHASTGPPFH